MKFSEYRETRSFRSDLNKKRAQPHYTRMSFLFCALGVLLLAADSLLVRNTTDAQKKAVWFFVLLAILTAAGLGMFVAAGIYDFRMKRTACVFYTPETGAGVWLAMKELGIDCKKGIRDGLLTYRILLPEGAGNFMRASVDCGGERRDLDLAPWDGFEELELVPLATMPLMRYLEEADLSSLGVRAVRVDTARKSNYDASEQGAAGEFVYREGKWTLAGKLLRKDYRRMKKYLKRQGIWED